MLLRLLKLSMSFRTSNWATIFALMFTVHLLSYVYQRIVYQLGAAICRMDINMFTIYSLRHTTIWCWLCQRQGQYHFSRTRSLFILFINVRRLNVMYTANANSPSQFTQQHGMSTKERVNKLQAATI